MDDKMRMVVGMAWTEMYASMVFAIENSGGHSGWFTGENFKTMKVSELFNSLATNDVRFYCTKTHELVKKKKVSHYKK